MDKNLDGKQPMKLRATISTLGGLGVEVYEHEAWWPFHYAQDEKAITEELIRRIMAFEGAPVDGLTLKPGPFLDFARAAVADLSPLAQMIEVTAQGSGFRAPVDGEAGDLETIREGIHLAISWTVNMGCPEPESETIRKMQEAFWRIRARLSPAPKQGRPMELRAEISDIAAGGMTGIAIHHEEEQVGFITCKVPYAVEIANHFESGEGVSVDQFFQTRLQNARKAKKLTQMGLGTAAGLSHPSWIAHFEAGRRHPNIIHLAALCRALGVSADYLLGLDGATGSEAGNGGEHANQV
jgi:DNA-binding XRE family transcriptional regulator